MKCLINEQRGLVVCLVITHKRVLAEVNLCQKLFFLKNMGENMLCTKIVLNVRNNFCTQHVLPWFELGFFVY